MRKQPTLHFLLVFDRAQQKVIERIDFGTDEASALAAYEAEEREHIGDSSIEVVLIGSDSWETVKLTHANYFAPIPESIARFFPQKQLNLRSTLH